MKISPEPDIYERPKTKEAIRYTGSKWTIDLARRLNIQQIEDERSLILDLSQIDFITLFEWCSVIAYLEILTNKVKRLREILIDAKGENKLNIVPTNEMRKHKKGENIAFTSSEIKETERIYKILGFIESLGGYSCISNMESSIGYRWIDKESVSRWAFYSRKIDEIDPPTILFPISRIESKDNCRAFIINKSVGSWREAMTERFSNASIFWSEEFWRVICYEFASNIWEHSDVAGFLSARVVEPCLPGSKEFLHRWQLSYANIISEEQKKWMKNGILEIVVADCGNGLMKTLEKTYREVHEISESEPVKGKDILCFAFDEAGTSKKRSDTWATERHALSRILRIVGKYGGSLRLRSGGSEIVYNGKGINSFTRLKNRQGIASASDNEFDFSLPGTQLQVLLPLYFPDHEVKTREGRSVLETPLPPSFQLESQHPIGHLVPLLEEIRVSKPWVGEEEAISFRRACERLCQRLLNRPRDEALILDFSFLQWGTEQFETLLHLLQNVLQHRLALLVEIDPKLAQQVVKLEETMASTQISPLFCNKSDGYAGKRIDEIGVINFLETYRGLHAILLGLDRNGRKILFGLPKRSYEDALLELINEPQSIQGLCMSHGFTDIDQRQITAILNGPNPNFLKNKNGYWQCVWDELSLAVQQRRSLARHFDIVAENCGAWRGRKKSKSNFPPPDWESDPIINQSAEFPETEFDKGDELFYLPWTREWRKEFLECARILSRERYSDEIARRLIYRLDRLLILNGKSICDVKTIACVTAPSMLLTEAIHRCWPIGLTPPAIADLGHYVLRKSDIKLPPRLIRSGGIVIIQDVTDKHNVTKDLVTSIMNQTRLMQSKNQEVTTEIIAQISFVHLNTDFRGAKSI